MKILQLNKLYSPWVGGVERIVEQISQGLVQEGEDVSVLCCQSKGKRARSVLDNVEVIRSKSYGMFWGMPIAPNFIFDLKKVVHEFDVIAIHHPFPLGDLALSVLKNIPPIVVHYHSDIVRQKVAEPLVSPLRNSVLKRASKIIVSSENLVETSKTLQLFSDKCEVVPFGVNIDNYQNKNWLEIDLLKNKYGKFVLFVGRFSYYKGVKILIEAIRGTGINLVMIGSGTEKESVKNMIEEYNLKNQVFLLDYQEEDVLKTFYSASEILVLPSLFRSEAFGLVILEALASGTPVISTELGTGTSFVNKNNETGLVVPPGNVSDLRRAMVKIMSNNRLRDEFSRNAVKRAKDVFSESEMISTIQKIYNEL